VCKSWLPVNGGCRTVIASGNGAGGPLAESAESAVAGLTRAAMFASVVLNANDVVLVTEAEPVDLASGGPRVLYVNPAFTRMTGYEPDEMVGLTPRILQSPKTDQRELDRLRGALRRWEPVEVELLNVHKDGTEFWAQINITPVADERGWYTHWVSIQRDITARKLKEQALQVVLDSSSDLVLGLRRDGSVVSASRTVTSMLGLPSIELLGADLRAWLHPADHPLLEDQLLAGFGPIVGRAVVELRLRHHDGLWRRLEVSMLEPGVAGGAPLVLSCVDVTELRAGAAALRQAADRFRSASPTHRSAWP